METLLMFLTVGMLFGSAPSRGFTYFGGGKYICRCKGGCTNEEGACRLTCNSDYFGKGCQYYDHVMHTYNTDGRPQRLFNKKTSKCRPEWEATYTTYQNHYMFHSVHFQTNELYNGEEIEINHNKTFDDLNLYPCNDKFVVWVKKYKAVYIFCERTRYVRLYFSGPGMEFVCSIQVTSGRDTATLQAFETEGLVLERSKGSYANDGNDYTCLNIHNLNKVARYKINMRTPVYLNLLYLKISGSIEPLAKTQVQAFSGDSVAFSFVVNESVRDQEGGGYFYQLYQYKKMPITSLLFSRKNSLRLCEVHAIGDSYCPHGYVGFDCDIPCLCATNKTCQPIRPECGEAGCGLGYKGETCGTPCEAGKYGLNCAETCPSYCADGDCSKENGRCFRCPDGKYGTLCDKEVNPETSERITPKEPCENCLNKDQSCDAGDGICKEGCAPGYLDAHCDLKCPSDHYGDFCAETCPARCKMGECHHVKGTCVDGCEKGYTGINCDQECPGGTFGEDCGSKCAEGCNMNEKNNSITVCDFVNGTCFYGCKIGFEGKDCNKSIVQESPSSSSPSSPSSFSPGTFFGGVAFLLISLFLLIIIFCRKKKSEEPAESDSNDLVGQPEKVGD